MFRVVFCVVPVSLVAVFASSVAFSQSVSDSFPGQVDRSPLPISRITAPVAPQAQPDSEPVATTVAGQQQQTSVGTGADARPVLRFGKIAPQAGTASDDLSEAPQIPDPAIPPSEAPEVNILAKPILDKTGRPTLETGDIESGAKKDSRFKAAPERVSRFDPTRQLDMVPLHMRRTSLKDAAKLRQLDKMTGQIQTYDIQVGEEVRVARLRVRLDACRAPKNNDVFGTMAFLKIWDTKYPEADEAFSGWMFAESPALSALDHPRFDVWVINCTTAAAE